MSAERKEPQSGRLFELVRFSAHQIEKSDQRLASIPFSEAGAGHSLDEPVGAS